MPSHQQTFESAILQTVIYADIFDYPLTVGEVHRYLVETPATLEAVNEVLSNGRLCPHKLARREDFVTLSGREHLVEIRQARAEIAARLWPIARHYAGIIATLPFVRMVAVTGSLAVDNADADADIDYLIVTAPGRLWLCRALVVGVVRWAALRGVVLCPNYFLSEQALVLPSHSLFMARELVQMVPLAGLEVYEEIRRLNAWTAHYLPNANGPPPRDIQFQPMSRRARSFQRASEWALRTPVGARLESWEMERKIAKFRHEHPEQSEAAFSADWCKGHFDGHGRHILHAFSERLHTLDEVGT